MAPILRAWPQSGFDGKRKMIASSFQKSGITIFLISITCVYYLLNAQILLGHYDLGWHLAAGDLIRQQGHLPLHDPWSFTAGNKIWINLSWLWDVCASALFQYTHFSGLLLFTVACGGAIAGCLTSICLKTGASAIAVCISVLSACLLYPAFAAFPNIYLAASPNMATMLFSVIFYGACLKRSRGIFLLPAIMLLWANLHGGFLLGLLVVAVFGGVALLKRDWAHCRMYFFVGSACFVATLINPLGWHIYQGTTTTVGNFVQTQITEWWPYYRNVTMPGSIPAIAYMAIFVVLELRRWRAGPIEARLLSWLFLFLGLYQFRYMSFFFLFSTVPMALHLDALLPRRQNDSGVQRSLLLAGAVAACALPLIFWDVEPTLGLLPMFSQQDALYLESHFPHARLLNHWNMGGELIFRTRGAIPIFVDGRASTAYPDSLLLDYFKLGQQQVNEADWDAVIAKYHIDTVLWMKSHDALRRFLVGKRGWTQAYAGQFAVIYFRPQQSMITP
jgi:hypothetical protein